MQSHKTSLIWQMLGKRISHAQLREIAKADYDQSVEQHYRALCNILDRRQLPPMLEWEPREVLSLCRWRKYDDDEEACLTVFFCSFSLIAAAESALSSEMLDGQVDNLIIAVDTARQLGGSWLAELDRYLVDLLPHISLETHDEDYLYFYLAAYLMAHLLGLAPQEYTSRLEQVIRAEKALLSHGAQRLPLKDILAYTCFDMRHELWRNYLKQCGDDLERRRVEEFGPYSA